MQVEQFLTCLPQHVEIHLNETGVTELSSFPWKGNVSGRDRTQVATDRPAEPAMKEFTPTPVQAQGPRKGMRSQILPQKESSANTEKRPAV